MEECILTRRFHRFGHKGCIACKKADKSGKTNFCTSCEVSVMQKGPAIIEIAEENETFKSGVYFLSPVSLLFLRLGLCLQLRGGSHSTVQAFVEAHHRVSKSSGHLQGRTDAAERGQVQRIPVRYVVTLPLPYPKIQPSHEPNFQRLRGSSWQLHRNEATTR
jgi:hypothetical protein